MNDTAQYLARAGEAGLVDEVLGHPYVADRYDDPITGRPQVLVEYCDPALVSETRALEALRTRLRLRHPSCGSVLLRVTGPVRLPAPWRPRLTYIEHGRGPASASDPAPGAADGDGLGVRPATPADDARVHAWLVRAFRTGYDGEVDPDHPDIAAVMENPGRLSFIAEAGGRPVGHGTVLTGERDEVTGEPYAELVDILVDPPEHRRAATSALVAAAVAATPDLPLRGHVVHPYPPEEAARAGAVLDALVRSGWSVDHSFWECAW